MVRSRGRAIALVALAIDVSSFGLRVEVEFEFAPGRVVDVIANGNPASSLPCRVIWVKAPSFDATGEAGLQFLGSASSVMANTA